MKKLLAILLSLVMITGLLACNGTKPETPAADGGKVEITGVHDMTVEAGHEIDVLEGVSAGDLTSMITIESSLTLDFKGILSDARLQGRQSDPGNRRQL